jgi:hypothetical protein
MWKNLLGELLGPGNQHSRQIQLGKLLNTHSDKVIAGYKIERDTLIRGVQHYHLNQLQASGRIPHVSTNGSSPHATKEATESVSKDNDAQNQGGGCGGSGGCLDYPYTRVCDDGAGESNTFYIYKGSEHPPLPPYPPRVISSTTITSKPQIKIDQQGYDLPQWW